MTDRYVGPGGADGNDGLSWANRKLTLNGVEDTPVVAGDTVYVGPGVYRETLTVDVSGTSGSPITYIGDVTGENTDSVGGIVRITGSDNDTTATRANWIVANEKNYRTFRGFYFDLSDDEGIDSQQSGGNWIVEDCAFQGSPGGQSVFVDGVNQVDWIIRRCYFFMSGGASGLVSHAIDFTEGVGIQDANHLIENCFFDLGGVGRGISSSEVGGITVRNCTIYGGAFGIRMAAAPPGGSTTITVENCIIANNGSAVRGTVTGEITEDFNTFYANTTDRTNVATGANSNTNPPLFLPPVLFDGLRIPYNFGDLSEWSSLARITGNAEPSDDLYGILRPTTAAKDSWGAIQLREAERETGTVQTGSAALTLADAGDHQIFVPVTATSTTFEVAARYESEYAGTLPRLIVRQPGAADQVDTMVAAADTWETLSLTFTPNADPPYVVVILRSLNTSVTGSFDTYWDDLDVS